MRRYALASSQCALQMCVPHHERSSLLTALCVQDPMRPRFPCRRVCQKALYDCVRQEALFDCVRSRAALRDAVLSTLCLHITPESKPLDLAATPFRKPRLLHPRGAAAARGPVHALTPYCIQVAFYVLPAMTGLRV